MTDITSIEIPASVKAIGYLAFNGCRNLKEVTMSKGTIFDKDTFPEGINIRYRETSRNRVNPKKRKVLNRRFNAKGVKHISYRCDRSVLCDRSVRCDTVSHL